MARRNLVAAADAANRHPDRARELGIDAEETASWRDAAKDMHIPFDEMLGVHPQAEKFTRHQQWDFAATKPEQYPLLLHFTYFDLYRKQVVKQADLVLAMFMCGDEFTAEQKARNFDYYEPITVRDSSLLASTQSIIAAEVGHLDLAYDYLGEAALMDLHDLEHNTRDGVHIASLAGSWLALVCGFGGTRYYNGRLSFGPRLPQGLTKLAFSLQVKGNTLKIEVSPNSTRYELTGGDPLSISHHGEELQIGPDQPQASAQPSVDGTAAPGPATGPGTGPARADPGRTGIAWADTGRT